MDQLMREATSDNLQLSADNMKKYSGGLATFKTMLCMLQDEMGTSSNTTWSEAMEARVCFQKAIIK